MKNYSDFLVLLNKAFKADIIKGGLEHDEYIEYLDSLQQPASPGWRPIESAPEDKNILAWESGIVYEVRISSMYKKFVHVPHAGFSPMWWMHKPPPPQHIACEQETGSQHIDCDLDGLVQALTDSENQPHQWVGNPDRLRELITTTTEEANDE